MKQSREGDAPEPGCVGEKKEPQKKDYQKILLPYIDIPYFKNNPAYLDQWRRYYESTRNPQILLLMNHKQIGTLHHWLFIQLAEHFKTVNKVELSSFILSEAIRNRVYDENKLKQALSRLPEFTPRYSRGDMLAVLNQRNIQALGKTWNKFDEVFYYEQSLEKEFVNFAMKRVVLLEPAHGKELPRKITIPDRHYRIMELPGNPLFTEKVEYSNSLCNETINSENTLNEMHDDTKRFQENKEDVLNDLEGESRHSEGEAAVLENLSGDLNLKMSLTKVEINLSEDSEFTVNGFIYLVREINSGWFTAMQIAEEAESLKTIVSKTVCFRHINEESAILLQRVRKYEFCNINESIYVMFPFDYISMLGDALACSGGPVHSFYLRQVLLLLREFSECGIAFAKLDFFIDAEFCIQPFGFYLSDKTEDSSRTTREELLLLFANSHYDFSLDAEELFQMVSASLEETEAALAILRHKAALLDRI